jgi:hypothetical protein
VDEASHRCSSDFSSTTMPEILAEDFCEAAAPEAGRFAIAYSLQSGKWPLLIGHSHGK